MSKQKVTVFFQFMAVILRRFALSQCRQVRESSVRCQTSPRKESWRLDGLDGREKLMFPLDRNELTRRPIHIPVYQDAKTPEASM